MKECNLTQSIAWLQLYREAIGLSMITSLIRIKLTNMKQNHDFNQTPDFNGFDILQNDTNRNRVRIEYRLICFHKCWTKYRLRLVSKMAGWR